MPVQRIKAHPKVEADIGRVALQRGLLILLVLGLLELAAFTDSACAHAQADSEDISERTPDLHRSFVWLASAPEGTEVYAVCRKQFDLAETPNAAVAKLFADSRYVEAK